MLMQISKQGLRFKKFDKTYVSRIAQNFSTESYTERQAKLGRPISPHVTIYKFPITAISSIANRFAGIALWIG